MTHTFEALLDDNYNDDDPLLLWARQSEGFAQFAAGRPVHFLRCPNLRARPNLADKLASLSRRLEPTGGPAPVVVIDHSREGPPRFKLVHYHEMIHRFAESTGLPPGNIIYASQNRLGPEQQRSLMQQRCENESYRWLNFDTHLHQTIRFHHDKADRPKDPTGGGWDYTFLCMNRRPRAHRMVVLAVLLDEPCRDLTLASYSWKRSPGEFEAAVAAAMAQFPARAAAVEDVAARLRSERIHLPGDENFELGGWLHDVPEEIANRTAMSIVTETHFTDGSTWRITEKTLKPILCRHPFILVGEYHSLALLESWGFDVDFAGIDRSYDEIRDPGARMEAVLDTIGAIAAPPESPAVRRIVEANRQRTEFNRHHLLHHLRSRLYAEAERCVGRWPSTAADRACSR